MAVRARDAELGDTLFESSARGQYALVEQLPHSARREILSGQSTVQQCFGAPNLVTLLDTPFAFVFVVVLGMLSPFLAGMTLLVMAGVALVSLLAQRRLREPMEAQSRIAIQMAGYQHNLTAGGEMVRAFSAADALRKNGGPAPTTRPSSARSSTACRTPCRTPVTPGR